MHNPALIQSLLDTPFVRINAPQPDWGVIERILRGIQVDCFFFRSQFLVSERSISNSIERLNRESDGSEEYAVTIRALQERCDQSAYFYRMPRRVTGGVDASDLVALRKGKSVPVFVIAIPGTRIDRLRLRENPHVGMQFDAVQISKMWLLGVEQSIEFRDCRIDMLVARVAPGWESGNSIGLLCVESGFKVPAGQYHLVLLNAALLDEPALKFDRGVSFEFSERILAQWYWPASPPVLFRRIVTPLAMHLHFKGILIPSWRCIPKQFRGSRIFGWRRETGTHDAPAIVCEDYVRVFANTYAALLARASLSAHSMALERYLAFFRSRAHWQQRLLYFIHGGYYRLLRPLIVAAASLAVQLAILHRAGPLPQSGVGEFIVNPAKLWGAYVLRDLGAGGVFDWSKLGVAVANIAMLYFGFAFAVAVKRRFGFPRESS